MTFNLCKNNLNLDGITVTVVGIDIIGYLMTYDVNEICSQCYLGHLKEFVCDCQRM